MTHPLFHAKESVRVWGGKPEDYLAVHNWLDRSKEHYGDFRHRALFHHSYGIFEAERALGLSLTNSDGVIVPVRYVCEGHLVSDHGFVPSVTDWLARIEPAPWMARATRIGNMTRRGD